VKSDPAKLEQSTQWVDCSDERPEPKRRAGGAANAALLSPVQFRDEIVTDMTLRAIIEI
jgi:hypothetical protein